MIAIHQDGLISFNTTFDGTSSNAYGMKNKVKAMLYC